MQKLERDFISQVFRYVGVALLSGSIVHAGTLGGSTGWYAFLMVVGVGMFVGGTILEKKENILNGVYIALSVVFSLGIGLISGGAQHFFDGPRFSAIALPLGFVIAYCAYAYRDYASSINAKRLCTVLALGLSAVLALSYVANEYLVTAGQVGGSLIEDHH